MRSGNWRRFDSLFMRLFVLQLLLAMAMITLFGVIFYIERSRTVATLQARLWAPVLRQATPGLPAPSASPGMQLVQRDAVPTPVIWSWRFAPRVDALRRELAAQGFVVRRLAFSIAEAAGEGGVTWIEIERPDGQLVWYGLPGRVMEPQWTWRLLVLTLVGGSLLAWAAWSFTRRLTRPLERLRRQIREGRTGDVPRDTEAPPEVAEIEAAHAELLRDLRQQERERGLLLAGVSHDLRSPLSRIRMAVELMPDSADTATRRAAIVRNVQAADRLVESFVDFVRSGELPLNESVDMAALVRVVVTRMERPAAELSAHTPESLLMRRTNGLLIERIVANLVDNALKHGRPPVLVVLNAVGGNALMEVHDHGPGIAAADREHLQQAFARGDASRGVAGAGLGLAIARQGARRLGGELGFDRVADEKGAGHVVRLRLPLGG